ncbi:hypothetical protein OHA72_39700 [Dactylosporangium sp. NBC_01737]|uniref:hypothetical protein n=1 Tax=Dactylosporangium sp. NBC_01737 TaxID=2975959 RepID=UPI002E10443D|nr:hypothetical protein OHA72_39700 [Dactylosporangium sp. NBC_01737]
MRGPAADAAVLLGAVDAMAAELGVAVERIDPLHAPAVRAAVRAALPAGQFDLAAHRGRALRRPDVVALLRPYR